jgi:hypothetical protein
VNARPGHLAPLSLLLMAACDQAPRPGPSAFVGTWGFIGAESELLVTGLGSLPLAGVVIRVTDGPSGLEMDLGCRCRVAMAVDGGRLHSLASAEQVCSLTLPVAQFEAKAESWTFDLVDDALETHAQGVATSLAEQFTTQFSASGTLHKRPDREPHCGGRNAVGVVPYFSMLSLPMEDMCPIGVGMDGRAIYMDGEDTGGCSAATGDSGEPLWVHPGTAKGPLPCPPVRDMGTRLTFCRVDGTVFSPFPVDEGQEGASYALLKLGDECPPGSVEVVKHISNERSDNRSRSVGSIAPNQVRAEPDANFTELHFCLFRPRPAEEGVQRTFIDLGVPYAVFHDFDGFQPSWVMSKRWLLNESDAEGNDDHYDPPAGPDTEEIMDMVEHQVAADGRPRTYIDLARVR